MFKMLLEIGSSRPAFVKMTIWKTCSLLVFSCEYVQVDIFFSFLVFSFRKDKSSNWGCSVKKDVPKSFANFTRKHLCLSLFLIKLQVFRLGVH